MSEDKGCSFERKYENLYVSEVQSGFFHFVVQEPEGQGRVSTCLVEREARELLVWLSERLVVDEVSDE